MSRTVECGGARFSWEGAMCIDGTRRRIRKSRRVALQAAACITLLAGCGFAAAMAEASAPDRAGAAQTTTTDDPCRYFTAEAMGKAFGRSMKGSKLANVCQYRGAGTDTVYVKVATGTEGIIFRHTKTASAQGQKGAEKVASSVGEAYFDSILPVFIGRVGNYEVQIETTIQPTPRDAMIAAGTQILATLPRK
jgi:hypothetical protein